jgi:hypothetical protein
MKTFNHKSPSTNNQIIINNQAPIINTQLNNGGNSPWLLEIGSWRLFLSFGYCNLVIGYFSGAC